MRFVHIWMLALLYVTMFLLSSCYDDNNETEFSSLYVYDGLEEEHPDHGLPVLYINTADGNGILDKETWVTAFVKLDYADGQTCINDTVLIKGRGNSTWHYPKKPFTMKFTKRQSVLGMKKHKRWVFLANYADKTLIRNDLTLHIAQLFDNLEWTPHSQFVDVMFNGHYVGNYLVCEQVRVDKNRLDIDELTSEDVGEKDITGGYLLCLDKYFDEEHKFRTRYWNLPVNIVSPDPDNYDESMGNYIKSYIDSVEVALKRHDFSTLSDKLIDYPSFIDFILVQAITNNHEVTVPRSMYCYKKRGGKLYAGPLWDFDYGTYENAESTAFTKAYWYTELLNDPIFVHMLADRWNTLSPILKENAEEYIDSISSYINLSRIHNDIVFPNSGKKVNKFSKHDDSTKKLRNNLQQRIVFLNDYINRIEREVNK